MDVSKQASRQASRQASSQVQDSSSDYDMDRERPCGRIAFTLLNLMVVDVLVYNLILPLIGTYLGGACAKMFNLSSAHELVLIVGITFVLLYLSFSFFGEVSYWKHLFAYPFEQVYANLLQVRDVVNVFIIMICVYGIESSVEDMLDDGGMKKYHLSEGTGYVFMKNLFDCLRIDPSVLPRLGLRLPHKSTIMDPSFGENEKFEHAASYILFWAMLSACMAKLVYFNTLFTFLRSMKIFLSLRPTFAEDDDEDDNEDDNDDEEDDTL